MTFPNHYFLPIISAILFSLATIFFKRAIDKGIGINRLLFISNWSVFLILFPVWFLHQDGINWGIIYGPLLVGLTGFCGGVFTFLALKWGDVSVVTPMMGAKVIFVAALSLIVLPDAIPVLWWVGVALTVPAVYLLGKTKNAGIGANIYPISAALCGSISFAFVDVLTQRWASDFGVFGFIVVCSASVALFSFILVPLFRKPLFSTPPSCVISIVVGGAFMGIQWMILAYFLSEYGQATAMNILYSSRAVWSIVLVWLVGPIFGNFERHLGHKVMLRRLCGAILLCVAIILVIIE